MSVHSISIIIEVDGDGDVSHAFGHALYGAAIRLAGEFCVYSKISVSGLKVDEALPKRDAGADNN